jgi:hypothetical protein
LSFIDWIFRRRRERELEDARPDGFLLAFLPCFQRSAAAATRFFVRICL